MADKTNPWLKKKLKGLNSPKQISLIVEVEPDALASVTKQLRAIRGISISRQAIRRLEVVAPPELVSQIESIPGISMVSYNMPKRIVGLPLLSKLTSIIDPLIGEIRIDNVICPRERLRPDMVLPFSPLRFIKHKSPLGDVNIIPTSKSREVILDVSTIYTGKGVTVAVLDTGFAPLISIYRGKAYSTCLLDPHPMDQHGHGSWCCSAAVGKSDPSFFGNCLGVAPEANLVSVKVLHGIFGFGTDMDVIAGIEKAVQSGAKIISMSLGTDESQGTEDEDPESRVINELSERGIIFVIAAGNSGPNPNTIGAPGCASKAITVGSVSMADYPEPAWFSSLGPQNVNNLVGDMKPDVLAPGGGRALQDSAPDEVILSGEVGWMQSMYTGIRDPHGAMMGTSQATPHIAGLCAILVQMGYNSADEIKAVFASRGHAKNPNSGWGIPKLSWFLS